MSTLEGINGCLIAYGLKNSGKSHSLFGEKINDNINYQSGIIHYGLEYLFDMIKCD